MTNTLVIGAGVVGRAVVHKCAQFASELGNITIASRTLSKCDEIIESVHRKGNLRDSSRTLTSAQLDAKDPAAAAKLIREKNASIVINVASPFCNLPIMEACLKTGAHYIDTAIYEREEVINKPAPWYAQDEWKLRDRFAERGATAVLSCGFDQGTVNAFCAHAAKHEFDEIETIDIMDVNGGDHDRFFATNFDPEVNLREILEDVIFCCS
ncbi:MAG: saccharopine dehydrogenase-like NADP-dependent oxidoreductase [Verrucomicrobiales bacterium]|jgi:saccharopine dehydrogenase-like NADP-dependent oxidoreductase